MKIITVIVLLFAQQVNAQPAFTIIPLGVKGGADEGNLSSYLVAPAGSGNYICLDAGTIHIGLKQAYANGLIRKDPKSFLRSNVKGYLLSHGHLDHVAGLVINSPDDSSKTIYVMPYVKKVMQEKYFTEGSWSNFSDEGEKPLNKYRYVLLDSAEEVPITGTEMFVRAFPLSHNNPGRSTAFLLRHGKDYLLYFGDTGPDEPEHTTHLSAVWKAVAPLIVSKQLRAVMLECSFSDLQPDSQLYGHLTPSWLMKEMSVLSAFTGTATLKQFPLIITHLKGGKKESALIKAQLNKANTPGLRLVFARQAVGLKF